MENEQTTIFTPLADEAFLSLGDQEIAYVKAINLPDGAHAIGIFSADGKPMAAAPSIEVAQALDPPARSRAGAGALGSLGARPQVPEGPRGEGGAHRDAMGGRGGFSTGMIGGG